jgi:hypothetical protein
MFLDLLAQKMARQDLGGIIQDHSGFCYVQVTAMPD